MNKRELKMAVGYNKNMLCPVDLKNLLDVVANMPMPCMISCKILTFVFDSIGVSHPPFTCSGPGWEDELRNHQARAIVMLRSMAQI